MHLSTAHPEWIGPAAALATSFAWTFTSLFFTEAGRRLGSTKVNAIRLVLAVILLGLTFHFFTSTSGEWFPAARSKQLIVLALSGFIGLTIGDQALFTAFVDIGPRLGTLIMTTAPIFATLFGWIFLGEVLSPLAWSGVLLTVGGVAFVVLERPAAGGMFHPRHRTRGILLALVGAACQAGGLLLSKIGIGHGWLDSSEHMIPQAATYIRMFFAMIGVIPVLILHQVIRRSGRVDSPPVIGRLRIGYVFVMLGTIFGPYFGVWMSLVAADATHVGIAQTLMSLTPVFILPFAAVLYRERIDRRAIIGAIFAVSGVCILVIVA